MKTILVLCGLPGSGKTTFAQTCQNDTTIIHDVDQWRQEKKAIEQELQRIEQQSDDFIHILDGLFLTHEDYERIVTIFPRNKIEFHYWIPNREICLHNDQNRRALSSRITIQYAPIEEPNIKKLQNLNNHLSLHYHQIYQK